MEQKQTIQGREIVVSADVVDSRELFDEQGNRIISAELEAHIEQGTFVAFTKMAALMYEAYMQPEGHMVPKVMRGEPNQITGMG